jgi:xanthine dehydrogenase accessory factor
MDDIFPILEHVEFNGNKVLATIIHVSGSSYKKEGSTMLFLADGTQIGMLSAGCLEEDLAYKAFEVMKTRKGRTVQYDLKEETDLMWGQGAGCNGLIEIWLEPIDAQFAMDLLKLKQLLYSNLPVLHLKKGENYLFLPCEGKPFGRWEGDYPSFKGSVKSGMKGGMFHHLFYPKPRLIVFGAGPDVRPLIQFAVKTGFSTLVCDWREEFCQKKYFPDAEKLMVGFPTEVIQQIRFTPYDFVVIASHHFLRDREILALLPYEKICYIGVLGPKERTKRLIGKMEIPSIIHSPIGLSIGAKGPAEIAISILGELIEEWRITKRIRTQHLWTVPE